MELDLHGQIKKRKGWQKVILLTIQGYFDNKVGRNAAAMTYYLLFAMFPFFIFVTSLLGLLHLPTLTLDGQITRFLPEDVVAFLIKGRLSRSVPSTHRERLDEQSFNRTAGSSIYNL